MKVLVSGASGYVGTELTTQLAAAGHSVTRLVRREARTPDESSWSPKDGQIDQAAIDSADAVVNLSGASLAKLPWTASYRRTLLRSRIDSTSTIVSAIAASTTPPLLLSGSAVGYYGDRPEETLTESSAKGTGFLADVVEAWEKEAMRVADHTRVVLLRTGIVVGHGGAFTPLELLTRFGLGAKLGDGTARWPWISLRDEAAAIVHLLDSSLTGPVNLVGPTPATSDAITKHLAVAMHRPRIWTIPRPLIELGLGAAGRELLLPSQRVVPERLLADGFTFRDETVESAISLAWPARD